MTNHNMSAPGLHASSSLGTRFTVKAHHHRLHQQQNGPSQQPWRAHGHATVSHAMASPQGTEEVHASPAEPAVARLMNTVFGLQAATEPEQPVTHFQQWFTQQVDTNQDNTVSDQEQQQVLQAFQQSSDALNLSTQYYQHYIADLAQALDLDSPTRQQIAHRLDSGQYSIHEETFLDSRNLDRTGPADDQGRFIMLEKTVGQLQEALSHPNPEQAEFWTANMLAVLGNKGVLMDYRGESGESNPNSAQSAEAVQFFTTATKPVDGKQVQEIVATAHQVAVRPDPKTGELTLVHTSEPVTVTSTNGRRLPLYLNDIRHYSQQQSPTMLQDLQALKAWQQTPKTQQAVSALINRFPPLLAENNTQGFERAVAPLVQDIAQAYGIPSPRLEVKEEGQGEMANTWAYYNPNSQTIVLNLKPFQESLAFNQQTVGLTLQQAAADGVAQLLSSVGHELQHAKQDQVTENPQKFGVPKQAVRPQEWKHNSQYYNNPRITKAYHGDALAYMGQPVEADTLPFMEVLVDGVWATSRLPRPEVSVTEMDLEVWRNQLELARQQQANVKP